MVSIIIMSLSMLVLLVFGVILINGRGSSLIAGFNTMSSEEKKKYDTVALCKFMGKMMFALSFSMLLWILSDIYEIEWLLILGIALFIGITIFMLIYANTGNRFRK